MPTVTFFANQLGAVVGDGTTDDTSALQAALDAVPSGEGIIIPAEMNIRLTSFISLSNKEIHIYGIPGARITQEGTAHTFLGSNFKHSSIRGLTFINPNGNNSIIRLNNSNNVLVGENVFRGQRYGVELSGCLLPFVFDNRFNNSGINIQSTTSGSFHRNQGRTPSFFLQNAPSKFNQVLDNSPVSFNYATSISNVPDYIGQYALVGIHWYKANGISSSNDWIILSSGTGGAPGGATALDDLTDVTITSVASGQHLIYDETAAVFVNRYPVLATSIQGIPDYLGQEALVGTQFYKAKGTSSPSDWVRISGVWAANDLTDVTVSSATSGQYLIFDETANVFINRHPVIATSIQGIPDYLGQVAVTNNRTQFHIAKGTASPSDWVSLASGNHVHTISGALDTMIRVPKSGQILQFDPVTLDWTNKYGPGYKWVNVLDYGASGNASFDDSEAFNRASSGAGYGGTVYIPPGRYMLSQTFRIRQHQQTIIAYGAELLHNSTFIGPTVLIGPTETEVDRWFNNQGPPMPNDGSDGISTPIKIRNVNWLGGKIKFHQPASANGYPVSSTLPQPWISGDIGIKLINSHSSMIQDVEILGFKEGISLLGYSEGCVHNHIRPKSIWSCLDGIRLFASGSNTSSSGLGWVNANNVFGARIGLVGSDPNASGGYGINVDYSPTYGTVPTHLFVHGAYIETSNTAGDWSAIVRDNGYHCRFDIGYEGTTPIRWFVNDLGKKYPILRNPHQLLLSSPSLACTTSGGSMLATNDANFLGSTVIDFHTLDYVGRIFRIKSFGYMTANNSGVFNFQVKHDSTVLMETGLIRVGSGNAVNNVNQAIPWVMEGDIVLRSINHQQSMGGAPSKSGTVIALGSLEFLPSNVGRCISGTPDGRTKFMMAKPGTTSHQLFTSVTTLDFGVSANLGLTCLLTNLSATPNQLTVCSLTFTGETIG